MTLLDKLEETGKPTRLKAWQIVEKGWCRGELARDLHGDSVSVRSELATKWCLVGAILYAYGVGKEYYDAHAKVCSFLKSSNGLAWWNDDPTRTQAEIVEVLRGLDI